MAECAKCKKKTLSYEGESYHVSTSLAVCDFTCEPE